MELKNYFQVPAKHRFFLKKINNNTLKQKFSIINVWCFFINEEGLFWLVAENAFHFTFQEVMQSTRHDFLRNFL